MKPLTNKSGVILLLTNVYPFYTLEVSSCVRNGGITMLEFLKRNQPKKSLTEMPEFLRPEDPVNYNSVLDYLVGLSKADYNKMIKSADIYRDANAKVAKVVGVKDEPTHTLMPEKPSDDQIDEDLDNLLASDDLETAFLDDAAGDVEPPQKPQAPSKPKTVEVKE